MNIRICSQLVSDMVGLGPSKLCLGSEVRAGLWETVSFPVESDPVLDGVRIALQTTRVQTLPRDFLAAPSIWASASPFQSSTPTSKATRGENTNEMLTSASTHKCHPSLLRPASSMTGAFVLTCPVFRFLEVLPSLSRCYPMENTLVFSTPLHSLLSTVQYYSLVMHLYPMSTYKWKYFLLT